MPYIKNEDRNRLRIVLDIMDSHINTKATPGDLNYIITKIVHSYIEHRGLNYTHLNDVVGVLESAKAEFQRRVVNPYEDLKIEENGDL